MRPLAITNIESLREEAALVELVRDIARHVVSHPAGKLVVLDDLERAPRAGWSALRDTGGNGVAVHSGEVIASDTPLAGIVTRLRSAQAVWRFLGQDKPPELLMVEEDVLSPEWRLRGVRIGDATVWVGVLGDWHAWCGAVKYACGSPMIRTALLAHVPEYSEVRPGAELSCSDIRFELVERGVTATIVDIDGGMMKIRVDAESDEEVTWSPGVRLDLGEIEMAFEDLLGLQPGSELEIEVAHPIRTYLRVGHSQLAVGELDIREGGLVIKIVEVL